MSLRYQKAKHLRVMLPRKEKNKNPARYTHKFLWIVKSENVEKLVRTDGGSLMEIRVWDGSMCMDVYPRRSLATTHAQ